MCAVQLAEAFEAGKIVSSVCHGPVAFSNVKLSNGKYMVDSRKVCVAVCVAMLHCTASC